MVKSRNQTKTLLGIETCNYRPPRDFPVSRNQTKTLLGIETLFGILIASTQSRNQTKTLLGIETTTGKRKKSKS